MSENDFTENIKTMIHHYNITNVLFVVTGLDAIS